MRVVKTIFLWILISGTGCANVATTIKGTAYNADEIVDRTPASQSLKLSDKVSGMVSYNVNQLAKVKRNIECSKDKLFSESKKLVSFLSSKKKQETKINLHDESCKQDPNDPHEPTYRIRNGKDKGKCIYSGKFRPLKILSRKEAERMGFKVKRDHLVVANIDIGGEYFTAQIPMNEIKVIKLGVVEFDKIAGTNLGHPITRVEFKKPILLLSQDTSLPHRKLTFLNELVFSVEAASSDGTTNSLKKATDNSYALSMGAYALYTKRVEMYKKNMRVRQYKLKISKEQKRAYLRDYIVTSHVKGLSVPYNAFSNNCGTAQRNLFSKLLYRVDKHMLKSDALSLYGSINPDQINHTSQLKHFILKQTVDLKHDKEVQKVITIVADN